MILVLHQDLASRQEFYYIHYLGFASFENAFAATTSTGYEFELLFFGQS
jgi:hypothetical protein